MYNTSNLYIMCVMIYTLYDKIHTYYSILSANDDHMCVCVLYTITNHPFKNTNHPHNTHNIFTLNVYTSNTNLHTHTHTPTTDRNSFSKTFTLYIQNLNNFPFFFFFFPFSGKRMMAIFPYIL